MENTTCVVPDCDRKRQPGRGGKCGMHYQREWKAAKRCQVQDCDGTYLAKGMCVMHYKRALKGVSFDLPKLGFGKAAGCAVSGCAAPYHAKGYCGQHAQRLARTGDPLGYRKEPRPDTCTVTSCSKPHFGLGYCIGHYKAHARHGSPEPQVLCKWCGEAFVRPLGKVGAYEFCGACVEGPLQGSPANARRMRRAKNNAGMTLVDLAEARDYRGIIATDPCVYCGAPSGTVDHINSVATGGSDHWVNLAPACLSCNASKNTRHLLDYLEFRLAGGTRELPRPFGLAATFPQAS